MWMRIFSFVLLVGYSAAQQGRTECRVCPESCITFPREDGGCQICICDGVAKSDCERTTCQAGCRKELDAEGCNACKCDPICPAVRECPDGCDHRLNDEGCIVCDCGDNNNVCEAVPACAKGCIDMRMDTMCFSCNCTLEEDTFGGQGGPFGAGGFGGRPFRGRPNNGNSFGGNANGGDPILETFFGGNNFGGGGFGGGFNAFENDNRRRPNAPTPNRPFGGFQNQNSFNVASGSQTSTCPAVNCPRNCRIGMDDDGCRQCLCGEDAMMCPGVDQCFGRCITTDPETNCCDCTCAEETQAFVNEGSAFETILIFTPNGVTRIITPGIGFNGPRRPGGRPAGGPGQRPGRRPEPILPNEPEAEFSPEFQPNVFDPQNPLNPFNPTAQIPVNANDNNPFNQNFPNPANPNQNGNNPPFINPVDPIPPVPTNPATNPNVNNNNPTNLDPVIPEVVEPQNLPDVDPVIPGAVDPQNIPDVDPVIPGAVDPQNLPDVDPVIPGAVDPQNIPDVDPVIPGAVDPQNIPDVDPVIPGAVDPQNLPDVDPVIPGAVDPQNIPDRDCPSVEEVTCGGECEPIAGPDGCPTCECGLLRRIGTRPVVIVDENAPPGVFANAEAEANNAAGNEVQ